MQFDRIATSKVQRFGETIIECPRILLEINLLFLKFQETLAEFSLKFFDPAPPPSLILQNIYIDHRLNKLFYPRDGTHLW